MKLTTGTPNDAVRMAYQPADICNCFGSSYTNVGAMCAGIPYHRRQKPTQWNHWQTNAGRRTKKELSMFCGHYLFNSLLCSMNNSLEFCCQPTLRPPFACLPQRLVDDLGKSSIGCYASVLHETAFTDAPSKTAISLSHHQRRSFVSIRDNRRWFQFPQSLP